MELIGEIEQTGIASSGECSQSEAGSAGGSVSSRAGVALGANGRPPTLLNWSQARQLRFTTATTMASDEDLLGLQWKKSIFLPDPQTDVLWRNAQKR